MGGDGGGFRSRHTRNITPVVSMCSRDKYSDELKVLGVHQSTTNGSRVPIGVPRGLCNSLGVTDLIITGEPVACDGIGELQWQDADVIISDYPFEISSKFS